MLGGVTMSDQHEFFPALITNDWSVLLTCEKGCSACAYSFILLVSSERSESMKPSTRPLSTSAYFVEMLCFTVVYLGYHVIVT